MVETYKIDENFSKMGEVLFCPWNHEGEANMEYLEFLREVNDHMLKHCEDYVAISGYGSQFKAYANEGSDFDIIFIGADSKVDTMNKLGAEAKEIGKKYGKEVNCPFFRSKEFIEANLNPKGTSHPDTATYSHAVWFLAFPLIGNKDEIARLRMMAKEKHDKRILLNPESAKKNFNDAIKDILYWEFNGIHIKIDDNGIQELVIEDRSTIEKMKLRGITEEQIREVIIARERMWRQRIKELLENGKVNP